MVKKLKKGRHDGLTQKQKKFIQHYLIDFNALQAAIAAGYSKKTAGVTGCENLKKPKISAAIKVAVDARAKRTQIDADYVLKRLASIDQMDLSDILTPDGAVKPIPDWPKTWRTYLSGMDVQEIIVGGGAGKDKVAGMLKKIKWPDKVKNLELLGRHVNVQAWKEVKEIKQEVTFANVPAEIASMIKPNEQKN